MLLYLSMSNISFDYSNADILVTGGTSGIGKAIAEAYLASGANVTITGTKSSKEDYQDIPKELSYIKLNLEDERLKQLLNLNNEAGGKPTGTEPEKCETYLSRDAVKSLCPGCV